jgi:tetrapyrrole methylase family protein/MazG family protein
MSITILGLGPGDPDLLTLQARHALARAREIYLRTREHPTVAALPKHLRIHSFDHLYRKFDDFEVIYTAMADEIVTRGQKTNVLYAVPGHPLYGERSVQKILAQAREKRIPVRVIAGVSFVEAACAALALDPLEHGLQLADATDLARQHFPPFDPDRPAFVGQLYSRAVASDCKLTLLVLYPPEHPITLIDAAGTPKERVRSMPLEELDHAEHWAGGSSLKHLLTTLYVPPLLHPGSFESLAEIIAHLRAPEGCPWDREQTHRSLRNSLLEEAYEVLEAIDADDMPHLQEELGDLLLHVLLQSQIAVESGEFSVSDVIAEIAAKLVRRHPHVFGDVRVNGTDEIIANWEKIKQAENGGKPKEKPSVPRGLPALVMAEKVAKRGKMSPDLKEIAGQIEKLARSRDREKALGAILFSLAAYASAKDIDAESALRTVATERK